MPSSGHSMINSDRLVANKASVAPAVSAVKTLVASAAVAALKIFSVPSSVVALVVHGVLTQRPRNKAETYSMR